MVYTVIFEVDIKNNQILFFHTGSLSVKLKAGILYDYEKFLEHFILDNVYEEEKIDLYQNFNIEALRSASVNKRENITCDFRLRPEGNREYRWFTMSLMLPHGAGGAVGAILDIHDKKMHELEMQHQASHDAMTNLLNRQAFERAVFSYFMQGGKCGAYCLMDVDDFKRINDTRGHAYGDIALMKIAKILTESVPEGTITARYGGDEFCMFLPGMDREEQLEPILKEILAHVKKEEYGGMQLSLSVGVAFYPKHRTVDKNSIGKYADVALYKAKESGKDSYCFYCDEMGEF